MTRSFVRLRLPAVLGVLGLVWRYRPGAVDSQPTLKADSQAVKPETPRRHTHRFDRTRTDLIPVSRLIALAEQADADARTVAEADTAPIPSPMLYGTADCEQLLEEMRDANRPAAPRYRARLVGPYPAPGHRGLVVVERIPGGQR